MLRSSCLWSCSVLLNVPWPSDITFTYVWVFFFLFSFRFTVFECGCLLAFVSKFHLYMMKTQHGISSMQLFKKNKIKASYWKRVVFEGAKPAETVLRWTLGSRTGAVLTTEPTGSSAWYALSLNCASWHRSNLPGSQLTKSRDVLRSNVQLVCPCMMSSWGLTKALP